MNIIQVAPKQAFDILQKQDNSILVDVRTKEEHNSVGIIDLGAINNKLVFLEWRSKPSMAINENFVFDLDKLLEEKFSSKKFDSHILFLCRVGGRSLEAAEQMTKKGYNNCYNIIGGFEGDVDQNGQRGKINGWKASNLSWRLI